MSETCLLWLSVSVLISQKKTDCHNLDRQIITFITRQQNKLSASSVFGRWFVEYGIWVQQFCALSVCGHPLRSGLAAVDRNWRFV